MKHIQSYETFINESQISTEIQSIINEGGMEDRGWTVTISTGGSGIVFNHPKEGWSTCILTCGLNGKGESNFQDMRNSYSNKNLWDTKISADKWTKNITSILKDIKNVGLDKTFGIFDRPASKDAKAELESIIKKYA